MIIAMWDRFRSPKNSLPPTLHRYTIGFLHMTKVIMSTHIINLDSKGR